MPDATLALISYSTGWGGLEMNVIKLARELQARGIKLLLITQPSASVYIKGSHDFNEVTIVKRRLKYFDIPAAYALSNVLRKHNIKKVLCFDNNDLDLLFWLKTLYNKNTEVFFQQHKQIGIPKRDMVHNLRFNIINTWIAPTQYLKDEILSFTGFDEKRIQIVPIGVKTERFTRKTEDKWNARRQLGINSNVLLIGIAGRIAKNKGQLFIAKAVVKLREEGQGVELLICGSPTIDEPGSMQYHQQLKAFCADKPYIHLLEYMDDISGFYKAIDLFVLASEKETYGMVTIEAMLSEIPVIGTSTGSTPELLGNGQYGLLYKPGDYQSFKQQFQFYLNANGSVKEMAGKAKQYAMEKYSMEKEVSALLEITLPEHEEVRV